VSFVQMKQKIWLNLNQCTGETFAIYIYIYNTYVEVISKQHQYMNQRHQILKWGNNPIHFSICRKGQKETQDPTRTGPPSHLQPNALSFGLADFDFVTGGLHPVRLAFGL